LTIRIVLLDLEFKDLPRTQHLGPDSLTKDDGEKSLRSRRRRGNRRNGGAREIPFLWSRSRAVFMQWLNPAEWCYRRDGKRGLSSGAPANRDTRERRAKFFNPEIFGPSK